jgi:hypothetical protein
MSRLRGRLAQGHGSWHITCIGKPEPWPTAKVRPLLEARHGAPHPDPGQQGAQGGPVRGMRAGEGRHRPERILAGRPAPEGLAQPGPRWPGHPVRAVRVHAQADFKKQGRFGCPACYDAFKGILDPMLEGMHKGTVHSGKVPQKALQRKSLYDRLTKLEVDLSRRSRPSATRTPPAAATRSTKSGRPSDRSRALTDDHRIPHRHALGADRLGEQQVGHRPDDADPPCAQPGRPALPGLGQAGAAREDP